jgi:hypothetical protein
MDRMCHVNVEIYVRRKQTCYLSIDFNEEVLQVGYEYD